MPLKYFTCPDGGRIEITDCLKEGGCRCKYRCGTRSYLRMVSSQRTWTGKPSTTQLITGTMQAYLRLTEDYAVSPDARAFMVHGTRAHNKLQDFPDEHTIAEQKLDGDDTPVTGIFDVLETENEKSVLVDYKTAGSFKVAKALGFYVEVEETGQIFKSGKRKGQKKTRKVLRRDDTKIDRREWELQLNNYRIEVEKRGHKVDELRIMCVVRDGNTYIARNRGVFRNTYYFKVAILPDHIVLDYFKRKRDALLEALKHGWKEVCSYEENWNGMKCAKYCEVAEFCSLGKYLRQEKEIMIMPIKGVSDVRRFPRLGKLRLGEKRKTAAGKEYPAEIDYFRIDPMTASDITNTEIASKFHELYGDKPKSFDMMFPVSDIDTIFPQYYKRYITGGVLLCKGDGEEATAAADEYAKGLDVLRRDERDSPIVSCKGRECPYYLSKKCSEVATLQVLIPNLPGAGVWHITTGSYHSIVNLNSCMDYIQAVAGRFHMLPLILERRAQKIQHDGKSRMHYILHINMNISHAELQRAVLVEPSKIMPELPAPDESVEDIYLESTPEDVVRNGKATTLASEFTTKGITELAKELASILDIDVVDLCTFMDAKYEIEAQATYTLRQAIAKQDSRDQLALDFRTWHDAQLSTELDALRYSCKIPDGH